MLIDEEDYISHIGVVRRSGRYPWGSGEPDNIHNTSLIHHISELRKEGYTDTEIAKGLGMTRPEMQSELSNAKNAIKQQKITQAQRLKDKGTSTNEISKQMGESESTVRKWLEPGEKDKLDVLQQTSNTLRDEVEKHGMIDIGRGVENYLGVSTTRLNNSVTLLKQEGYVVHVVPVRQVATGHDTKTKVLALPGTTQRDVFMNRDNIQLPTSYSNDGGRTYSSITRPLAIDHKRVGIVYGPDGGAKADGVIYVRPGVKDVELGGKMYAQVRIQVGDKHYLKGMAIYKDDLPDGVDLQFNTNKKDTGHKFDAMKKLSDDPDLPFGTITRQIFENEGTPQKRVSSVMNIINEEGQWETWSRTLSSQMLSKQSPRLAKEQLDVTHELRKDQYDDIMKLTNSTVRKKLLEDFADSVDSSAVHLEAAALPGQTNRVILPISKISPTHIYAQGYNNGDRVVLIRHPHGGTFEIPELVVNNRNPEAKKLLGEARDAVGIHHSVAHRLSGADFDGDTVLVIPNRGSKVTVTSALEGLKNFDPRTSYKGYEGMKVLKGEAKQNEMGRISNLITDMSIAGAPTSEIARAIKHSMVVIDAENHELDHRRSYQDNGIKALKQKYQRGGASTIISRAGAKATGIPQRKARSSTLGGPVDPVTGQKMYEPTNRVNYRTGKLVEERTTRLAEATDARSLMSTDAHPMERLYASHSNKLKGMANKARLEALNTPPSKWNKTAKETYKDQVASLDAQLVVAKSNAPLERQAQRMANVNIKLTKEYNPDMKPETEKKVRFRAQEEARLRTGAGKKRIEVTQEEWDAIQAGAISNSKLVDILKNADMSKIREFATPKDQVLMTSTKKSRASSMFALGYTRAEVASQLGVSLSTLDASIAE